MALLVAGLYLLNESRVWGNRFEEWLIAEPARIPLLPCAPASYEVPFRQRCSIAHAQVLWLEPCAGGPSSISIHGIATLRSPDGREAGSEPLDSQQWSRPDGSEGVRFARFFPPPEGNYTLRVTIDQMSGLPDRPPATLVMRNELCGLERLPGTMMMAAGCGVLLLGLIPACFLFRPRHLTQPPTVATTFTSK